VPALVCLTLAAALPRAVDPRLAEALRSAWSGNEGHVLWDMAFSTWPILLVVPALALAAAAASGSLGWVEGDRSRLGRVGAVRPGVGMAVLGAAVLVALALAVRGVVAGATRGVAASEASLVVLWIEWLRRALLAAGCVTLVAAALELVMMRSALDRALHQSRREAREASR